MAALLSELRDALSSLGISTSTGGLRGEERRLELVKRLQQAQGTNLNLPGHDGSGFKTLASKATLAGEKDRDISSSHIDTYQHMALGALRKALEERGQSTQTSGLKGDARRHALVQRLVNTHAQVLGLQQQSTEQLTGNEAAFTLTGRESVSDGGDDADTKSVTSSSSSSYSAASEFLFFNFPSGRAAAVAGDAGTKLKQRDQYQHEHQHPQVPALALDRHASTSVKKCERSGTKDSQSSFFSASAGEMDQSSTSDGNSSLELQLQSQLRNELFEKRKQLHQLRRDRHEAIERCMHEAGFAVTLDTLSLQLERLEKERQRLMQNYFAHELVASTVLSFLSTVPSDPAKTVELVQEDAIQLLNKLQEKLRKQVKQTKAALEIVRTRFEEDNNNNNSEAETSSDTEVQLTARIQQVSELLYQQQKDSGRSLDSRMPSWRSAGSSSSSNFSITVDSDPSLPVLTRCRSMPSAMFKDTWNDLEPEQKQQLYHELRTAASYRIKSDRVSLGGHFGSLMSRIYQPASILSGSAAASPPSQADRLGIKALFLERAKRGVLETSRTYQQAIALDPNHAANLGNYARFLYLVCGNLDSAHEHFQLALQVDPLNAQNLMNYANFLKRARHNLGQAEKYYQQALRLAPNDVNVLGNYADLLMKKGDNHQTSKRQAKALLELALQSAPGHIKNRLQLAAVLTALGDPSSAERCYEQLISSIERQTSATSKQQKAGGTDPQELAHVHGNYANFLRKRKQWEKAKRMYSKALALLPRHPLLLRNLYVVCLSSDDSLSLSLSLVPH